MIKTMKHIKNFFIALAFVFVMPMSQAAVGGGQELIIPEIVESIIAEEIPKQMEMVLCDQDNSLVPEPASNNLPNAQYNAYPNNQVFQQVDNVLLESQRLSTIETWTNLGFVLLGLVPGLAILSIVGFLLTWWISSKSDRMMREEIHYLKEAQMRKDEEIAKMKQEIFEIKHSRRQNDFN